MEDAPETDVGSGGGAEQQLLRCSPYLLETTQQEDAADKAASPHRDGLPIGQDALPTGIPDADLTAHRCAHTDIPVVPIDAVLGQENAARGAYIDIQFALERVTAIAPIAVQAVLDEPCVAHEQTVPEEDAPRLRVQVGFEAAIHLHVEQRGIAQLELLWRATELPETAQVQATGIESARPDRQPVAIGQDGAAGMLPETDAARAGIGNLHIRQERIHTGIGQTEVRIGGIEQLEVFMEDVVASGPVVRR